MPEPFARWTSFPPTVAVFVSIFLVLAGFSLSLDLPKTKLGFQGDEATYYSLGHSLARDLDFTFERHDLVRVWEEFPAPEGIFLKRGKTVHLQRSSAFPYVRVVRTPDPRQDRLYYGKSFVYPLIAAPFVRAFGTNGFLVLHALLVTLDILAAYTFLARLRQRFGVQARLSQGFGVQARLSQGFGAQAPARASHSPTPPSSSARPSSRSISWR